MKKTVSLVLILTLLTVFFCSHVFASTANPTVSNYKRVEQTKNGVTIRVSGVQTNGYSEGFFARYGGTGTSFNAYNVCNTIITITITNNTSVSKYLTDMYMELKYNDTDSGVSNLSWYAAPRDFECYGPDFTIAFAHSSGSIDWIPNADWSFGNRICIPANTSLSCLAVITFPTQFGTNDNMMGSWQDANLDSINLFSNWTAYDTDFTPQGAHDDLLISLEALRNYLIGNGGLPLIDNDLDNILNEITWTGTYTNASFGTIQTVQNTSNSNYKIYVREFPGIPITDFEALPPNVVIQDVLYKINVCIEVQTSFTEEQKYNDFIINNIFPESGVTFDVPTQYSSWINAVAFANNGGYYWVHIKSDDNIIPSGNTTSTVWVTLYSRNNTVNLNGNFTVTLTNNTYNSDLSTDSNDLKNTSDSVHTQEQIYFAQNQQAIQATGLSNYQFSSADGSGISAVSNDFTTIWNALSGWNSVYVFSLTLGLALTILRHAPNAISRRRRKQSND